MSAELVMVDTSIWIDFFNRPSSKNAATVMDLLDEDRIVTTGVILAEIIQGIKTKREKQLLLDEVWVIPFIPTDRDDWIKTGWMLNELMRKGITAPITDTIIARLCLRYNILIFTLDKHFNHFSKLKKFRP